MTKSAYSKALTNDLTWLKTNGKKAGERLQSAIDNLAKHTDASQDWVKMHDLVKVAKACSGIRFEGVLIYLKAVFPFVKYDNDAGVMLRKTKKAVITVNLEILDVPFWDYSKESAIVIDVDKIGTMTVEEIVAAHVAKATKRLDTDSFTGDKDAAQARLLALVA